MYVLIWDTKTSISHRAGKISLNTIPLMLSVCTNLNPEEQKKLPDKSNTSSLKKFSPCGRNPSS